MATRKNQNLVKSITNSAKRLTQKNKQIIHLTAATKPQLEKLHAEASASIEKIDGRQNSPFTRIFRDDSAKREVKEEILKNVTSEYKKKYGSPLPSATKNRTRKNKPGDHDDLTALTVDELIERKQKHTASLAKIDGRKDSILSPLIRNDDKKKFEKQSNLQAVMGELWRRKEENGSDRNAAAAAYYHNVPAKEADHDDDALETEDNRLFGTAESRAYFTGRLRPSSTSNRTPRSKSPVSSSSSSSSKRTPRRPLRSSGSSSSSTPSSSRKKHNNNKSSPSTGRKDLLKIRKNLASLIGEDDG